MKTTFADLTGVDTLPLEELSSLHHDVSNRVLLYGVVIKEEVGRREEGFQATSQSRALDNSV